MAAPTEFEKTEKRIRKAVWNAVKDYDLIQNGDKIMVCLSGGKDSYTLLDCLLQIQKTDKYNFDIVAVNLDQKQPGFPEHILPEYLERLGVEYLIVEEDTYSIVKEKTPEGKSTCSLCSRLRRGNLYSAAEKLGCNKLALGHHRDDIIETFFLNLFFAGKIETMPMKYKTNDGRFDVIRPLGFVKEKDIIPYSVEKKYPIIPCNLCGSQPNMQRQITKAMLATWEEKFPGRNDIMFTALGNISPTHMLDKELLGFVKEGKKIADFELK